MLDFLQKMRFNIPVDSRSLWACERISYRWMTGTGEAAQRGAEGISVAACRSGMNISGKRTVP